MEKQNMLWNTSEGEFIYNCEMSSAENYFNNFPPATATITMNKI